MSMNMNTLTEERNRGYLIAGIGGIVAFIAFFLPYFSVSAGIFSVSGSAAQVGGFLWLVFLLVLASIAVSALLIFRGNTPAPLGISGMPTATQIRYGVYGLIGAGALGVVLQLLNLLTGFGSYAGIGIGPAFGFWILLLALLAIAVGGILALRTVSAAAPSSQAFPQSPQQWPSVQSPQQQQWQQQWPSQQQSTQYAPPPQYTPPSQYPPAQYPPSQYPPSQYPPSQPSEQQWPPQQQQPPSQQQPWQ